MSTSEAPSRSSRIPDDPGAHVPAWAWRAETLGTGGQLELKSGVLDHFDRGTGRPVVFAHGWMANANLWRHVVDRLAGELRCITLDLPLGAHRRAMGPSADLTPEGCARLILEAIESLDLHDVTLVGNDSGGAYSQIATAADPDRIGRLVLNSCESPFDEFPPPPFDGLPEVAADVDGLGELLGALREPATRALPQAFGWLIKHPGSVDERAWQSYTLAALADRAILEDTAAAMSAASTASVHAAGEQLIASFDRPVRFLWSPEDLVFPVAHAYRYADALAAAEVTLIDDAYSFTPEDQPDAFADALAAFIRAT